MPRMASKFVKQGLDMMKKQYFEATSLPKTAR